VAAEAARSAALGGARGKPQAEDGAATLREIEIGYVSGKGFVTPDKADGTVSQQMESTTTGLSDVIILKPTFMGMGIDLSKAWQWLSQRIRRT